MIKNISLLFLALYVISCKTSTENKNTKIQNFTISSWVGAGNNFEQDNWKQKISYYDSLGINEILIGASPEILKKIIPLANKKNIKVHGWLWTLNRPNDTIAQKHPDWYAVNRNGKNSLEYRAYVDYYQWLSPFHPKAKEYIINNVKELLKIDGLASVHLDYVRYPDVILGADLQPKYNLIQETEMPEFDYGYHPIARAGFKKIFDKDPIDFKHPELSTEWRQYRLNAITNLVNEIAAIAHSKNKKITAAVFPFPEMSRQMVRQAWNDWNLDAAYPMLYQNFYRQNINWIGFAAKQGVKDVNFPVIAGLYSPSLRQTKDLEKAIKLAKQSGAKGISIYTADDLTEEQKAVLIKLKNSK